MIYCYTGLKLQTVSLTPYTPSNSGHTLFLFEVKIHSVKTNLCFVCKDNVIFSLTLILFALIISAFNADMIYTNTKNLS